MKNATHWTFAACAIALLASVAACTPRSDRDQEQEGTTHGVTPPGQPDQQPGMMSSPAPMMTDEPSVQQDQGQTTQDPGSGQQDQSTGRDAGQSSGR
jgi:hypothetical protein